MTLGHVREVGLESCLEKGPEEMWGDETTCRPGSRCSAKPKVILMDEPFASLDYQTRKLMQLYLLDAWKRAGSTVLLVTHNLSEAITLADRLVVFSGALGTIQDIIGIEAQRPRDAGHPKLAHLQSEIEAQLERAAAETEETIARFQPNEEFRAPGQHDWPFPINLFARTRVGRDGVLINVPASGVTER